MNILWWLLSTELKRSKKQKKNSGFTLIELLVAMILAVLVITPLLGFMVNILDTDRQEQAKVTSEQEIQTAIDYIARDLQQAIYIYDANALSTPSNTTDSNQSGIQDQIPVGCDTTKATCKPILVFWKREFFQGVTGKDNADDSFVYSLVAYYLIKDNNSNASSTWSKAARIARFQISDGVPNSNVTRKCPDTYDTDSTFSKCPDKGFKPFNLSQKGLSLQQKMNTWTKASDFTQAPLVLVDFIDQTTITDGAACPPNFPNPSDPNNSTITWSKISSDSSGINTKTGFYACVISVAPGNKSVVQVYVRGNALARVINDETKIAYNSNKSTYFPQVNVRVEGRGFIFTK